MDPIRPGSLTNMFMLGLIQSGSACQQVGYGFDSNYYFILKIVLSTKKQLVPDGRIGFGPNRSKKVNQLISKLDHILSNPRIEKKIFDIFNKSI